MAKIAELKEIGSFEFVELTPQAVADQLLAHPKIQRVWYKDETGEFFVLTDVGTATFTIDFPGEKKIFS